MPTDITKSVSTVVTIQRSCSECNKKWEKLEHVYYSEAQPDICEFLINDYNLSQGLKKEVIKFKNDYSHNIICPYCKGLSSEVVSSCFKDGVVSAFIDKNKYTKISDGFFEVEMNHFLEFMVRKKNNPDYIYKAPKDIDQKTSDLLKNAIHS